MLAQATQQFWAGAGAGGGGGTPPTGGPTGAGIDFVPYDTEVKIYWTPADATSDTQVGYAENVDRAAGPTEVIAELGPSFTEYYTGVRSASIGQGSTYPHMWWVRSYAAGVGSAWEYCGGAE